MSIDEAVYCFGNGINGQTGHGNNLRIGDDEIPNAANAKVGINLAISQVATGFNHTCVLTKDEGRVICFSLANNGQLGYGNTIKIGDDEVPGQFVDVLSSEQIAAQ